jgi:hypothetical protein
MKSKRGMAIEEIGKILLAVVLLGLVVFGVAFLLGGKAGSVLESIKNMLRFGR